MGGTLGRRTRELRSDPTDAERELWRHLRRDQFKGYKFRRQHPIGRYIVDFVCLETGTVIELDGVQHRDQKDYDEERTAWLKDKGYTVLRFWDNEVFSNIEGVKKVIWDALTPLPNPPPQGGRGVNGKSPQGGRGVKGEPPQGGRGEEEIVYIGLGSNLGDPGKNLQEAVDRIAEIPDVRVRKPSTVYRTEPVGGPPQPRFLNAAIGIETSLGPAALLRALRDIERAMGRARGARNSPRTIDLDILLFGRRVMRTPRLTVPHPRLHERRFALAPLAEIAGSVVHPGTGKTVAALLAGLKDTHGVERTGVPLRRKKRVGG